jgi:hypothetical protein
LIMKRITDKVALLSILLGTIFVLIAMLSGCDESSVVHSEGYKETEANSLLEINLLGEVSTYPIDSQGILQEEVNCVSTDGKFMLSLQEGTSIKFGITDHIEKITVDIADTPPKELPDGYIFVSPVYIVTPEQAELSSPIYVSVGYAADELPEGVKEDDVFMGNFPYIGCCKVYEEWDVPEQQSVDVNNNMVTGRLPYLLQYAVIAAVETSSPDTTPVSPTPTPGEPASQTEKVEVVYFHRAQRCHSCVYIEDMVRYTLETYFAQQLADGSISYNVYNVEDENNLEILEKYDAYTSSLFINTVCGGEDHIEEITTVWLMVDDDQAFINEIGELVSKALTGEDW